MIRDHSIKLRMLVCAGLGLATALPSLNCTRNLDTKSRYPNRSTRFSHTMIMGETSEAKIRSGSVAEIVTALKMSDEQQSKLHQRGLLVQPSPEKFGVIPTHIYDSIYKHDLPVLITSDSILYAFHRSYVGFLGGIELAHLSPLLEDILKGTRQALAQSYLSLSPNMATEVDVFLTVGLTLLDPQTQPVLAATPKVRIQGILDKIEQEKRAELEILGVVDEDFDYSQFKPRGHYAGHRELRNYFRALMWLGQARLPLVKRKPTGDILFKSNLETALALSTLLQQSGALDKYRVFTQVIDTFVGPADDDGPSDMLKFARRLKLLGDDSIEGNQELGILRRLHEQSTQAKLAALDVDRDQRSRIVGYAYSKSTLRPKEKVDRDFLFLGRRYTLDSEIFQNLVYDRVIDPKYPEHAVNRRLPKTLDIAAALGNPQAKTHLKDEFIRYPYESALDEMAAMVKAKPASFWKANVHSAWLAAIASLHANPDNPALAPVFRTSAWKDKTLQTQLASWTELRHDHLLYAKQSSTLKAMCEFPDAYVEPVPEFFAQMKLLVGRLHATLDELATLNLKTGSWRRESLASFAEVMDKLYRIAQKELNREPLSVSEQSFLKKVVKEQIGCGGENWSGWYPALLGGDHNVSFQPVVADVHTDNPDPSNGFVTSILHAATGEFEVATVLVECGKGSRCAYVGPVYSFHEFVVPEAKRMSDKEWSERVSEHPENDRPPWVGSFRVPR